MCPISVAFSIGKVQVRRDVIKQHCYLTLPLAGYLTPGRESRKRSGPLRANKGVRPSQEQICGGFEPLPRLLTHLLIPLSFQCEKQQNIYTLPDRRALCGPFKPSLWLFSSSFVFHVWFLVTTSKSFPLNNDSISKRSFGVSLTLVSLYLLISLVFLPNR